MTTAAVAPIAEDLSAYIIAGAVSSVQGKSVQRPHVLDGLA
jgi:hypothetical protein